jgi:hypothetical protein
LVVIPKRICVGFYAAQTIPGHNTIEANGKLLMPVSTLSSDRFTDTQSTTARLHITADNGVPVAASRRPWSEQ